MWNELWGRHKGRLIGLAAGLFLSIIYLISGFWDMLIVAFIMGLCTYVGGRLESGGNRLLPEDWTEKISRLADRWRWFR